MRSFLQDVLSTQADVTLIDMEAGLEHLSRSGGTLAYADVLLVIMEPSRKSVVTGARTMALANELGIPHTFGVGNKARGEDDVAFFKEACAAEGLPLAGVLPHDDAVTAADRSGTGITAGPPPAVREEIERVIAFVEDAHAREQASA